MLTKCPECELQISDKATFCPHCGYPLIPSSTNSKRVRSSSKRRRLPNGFGQIIEIRGRNLRKPFRATISIGKNEEGHCIQRLLKPQGYFSTYNEAYEALVEYNKNPYDLDDCLTVEELYERWSKEYFEGLKSESSKRTITSAWAYCSSIYKMRATDVRARHIKGCMDEGFVMVKGEKRYASPNTKGRIKSMFNIMLDYAVEYELVDKNYARTFSVSDNVLKGKEEAKRAHVSFTDNEMALLWENINAVPYVDVILIQCYSGWRPQELGLIRLEDVDLERWSFTGGMKTKAGTNRTVPIHTKIRELVKKRYEEAVSLNSEYLINCTDTATHKSDMRFTYDKYQKRFIKIRDRLGLDPQHRPHDGRKHFVTLAKKYGVDEYAIKYMIGHSINDLTERVYTDREFEWLTSEIEKIK